MYKWQEEGKVCFSQISKTYTLITSLNIHYLEDIKQCPVNTWKQLCPNAKNPLQSHPKSSSTFIPLPFSSPPTLYYLYLFLTWSTIHLPTLQMSFSLNLTFHIIKQFWKYLISAFLFVCQKLITFLTAISKPFTCSTDVTYCSHTWDYTWRLTTSC